MCQGMTSVLEINLKGGSSFSKTFSESLEAFNWRKRSEREDYINPLFSWFLILQDSYEKLMSNLLRTTNVL